MMLMRACDRETEIQRRTDLGGVRFWEIPNVG